MMRKVSCFLIAASLALAVSGVATARSAKERVEVASYLKPAGIWTSHFDGPMRSLPEDEFVFVPRKGERSVRFEFVDALGTDVLLHVTVEGQEVGDHGLDHAYSDGMIDCAPSYEMPLTSRSPIHVSVYSGLCPNHTFGFASSGTITATFSR